MVIMEGVKEVCFLLNLEKSLNWVGLEVQLLFLFSHQLFGDPFKFPRNQFMFIATKEKPK